ncbi:MAG: hypothetical protein JKY24_08195, partial [Pseudomonadales bacterium]|nr:hypothetical protein [Pseudomonadales bacterium]
MIKKTIRSFAINVSFALLAISITGFSLNAAATIMYERGPNPSASLLEAESGPFAVEELVVPSSAVDGFRGGRIFYPTNTTGTMGGIAVVSGFIFPMSTIKWWGPLLASHGFVVFTLETNSPFDFPNSRASQLDAALDHLLAENGSSDSPFSG